MAETHDLATLIREIYLERDNGVVEVRHAKGTESLFFRRGELYLDRDDDLALKISPLLDASAPERRPPPELCAAVEDLARQLVGLEGSESELQDDRSMVVEVVGPMPTVRFVQELAVHGCGEGELLARVGGQTVKLRSSDQTPALEQLPGLEPDMAQVLVHLENPTTPAELLRGAGDDRLGTLRGLTKLWAVGLVQRLDRSSEAGGGPRTQELLAPKLLATFLERIARDLDEAPVDLDPEVHRVRVAELLSRLGKMSYYDLLDIDIKASDDAVFAAFSRLARLVHPRHAPRLGLAGKDEALRVLFERAAEAYLTLSDPNRRAGYNTMAGIHRDLQIDDAQRQLEKRTIARQNYRRAAICLAEMDYSLAVDLLKEATRMDPQPEYFARLGMAQGKNPNWRHHAVESFRRAVELKPDDVGILFSFGDLLEDMDRRDEAAEQYRAVLELMPDHAGAREGLDRLGVLLSATAEIKARTGGFSSLFGGGSSEPSEPVE
jgi:tetratricopeptide (TPR) repeat protein